MSADPLRELARIGKTLYRRVVEAIKTPPDQRDPSLSPAFIRDDALRALNACDIETVTTPILDTPKTQCTAESSKIPKTQSTNDSKISDTPKTQSTSENSKIPVNNCRVPVTAYPDDEDKLRALLAAEGVKRLFVRGKLLLKVGGKNKNVSFSKPEPDSHKSTPQNTSDDESRSKTNKVNSDKKTQLDKNDTKKTKRESHKKKKCHRSDSSSDSNFHKKIKIDPDSVSERHRKNSSGSKSYTDRIELGSVKEPHVESEREQKVDSDSDSNFHKKIKIDPDSVNERHRKNSSGSESYTDRIEPGSVKEPQIESEHERKVDSDSDNNFHTKIKIDPDSVSEQHRKNSSGSESYTDRIKPDPVKELLADSEHEQKVDSGSDSERCRKSNNVDKIESDSDKDFHKNVTHRRKIRLNSNSSRRNSSSDSKSDKDKIESGSDKLRRKKAKNRKKIDSKSGNKFRKKARNQISSDSDNNTEKAETDSNFNEKFSKKNKRLIIDSDSDSENKKTKINSDSGVEITKKSKTKSDSDGENKKINTDSDSDGHRQVKFPRKICSDSDTENTKTRGDFDSDSKPEETEVSNSGKDIDKTLERRKNSSHSSSEETSKIYDKTPEKTMDVSGDVDLFLDAEECIGNSESENETCRKTKRPSKTRRESPKRKKVEKRSCENGKVNSEDSDLALSKTPEASNGHKSSSSNISSDDDGDLFSGMKNDLVSKCSESLEKRAMSEVISQLINGDTSNSDEESVPKVNGKMKNSSEVSTGNNSEMEHSNSKDKKANAKRSKKSKRLSPLLIDSDSDVQSNGNDNCDKVSVKDEDDDVKEILESSDSEDSEIFKPSKRRRKKKSSDKSNDESESDQKTKKKRRRIKNISGDESDNSENESGSENEGDLNKKGRKNIRKVKRSVNLDEATKTAARNERERIHRIAERQKLYNESMFDESGRPDEVIKLDKVVLDFDPESKEPLISVDKGLVEKLKPHQANGVKFMWNACFESVTQIKKGKGSGCILAHCMGLGKTLQIVTLTHTLLTHRKLTKVERVLVVCPLSTVHNWVNEFTMWLKFATCKKEIDIYEISKLKQNYERASRLKEWLENGGVCVLGYDMFRNLSAENNKRFRKTQLASFQQALVDPGPDMVVCDEGHLLKNEKTSLSQSMNKVKTLRRIVLTGTPLQNNLKEYYCMVQFVKPNLLGKYNEYLNRFVNPITNGQYTDSTEHDIRIMKRRSHVLHTMLDGAVQRRDYSVLAPFLPPKHEYVLFISLTEIQIKLYSFYMENFSRRPQPDKKNTGFLFPDFQALQRIWTHPLVLKANSERYEIMQQKKREKEEEDSEGSLVDFIDDGSTTPEETTEDDDSSEDSDDSDHADKKKKNKNKKAATKRITRATVVDDDDDDVIITKEEEPPPRQDNPTEWWMSLCSEDELDDVRHSNKLILLLDILKECEAIGDKLLVFSQSLYSLDLIEQFLWKIDEATQKGEDDQKLAGHLGSWSPGIDYFRLDGSTSCENRSIWCKNFNKEDNPRARLFLISTRAGGLGINLVAANRVVIFDMSWNPSHDVQSIFRVYRFGQKKPCYIYRFLALGTMEEKIYERQVTKQAISKRVIDEQQIDRHYAESDLAELYTFCPVPEGSREVPKLPKDRLFADLLKQHDTKIYKYHEHDSLLENKEEETLTEEERKAAWEDYENEKTRPPTIFGNQILAGFQQQQQHQLAMSALLQKENPNLSEQQLASMIPGLLQHMYQNGDPMLSQQMFPGYDFNLMQRMNSMLTAPNSLTGFKYPQSPMMNTNLSSMLSAGTGGSTGTYGNSWQQQQQIQLQRLQQQQAMQANLKYYAGGLGSRDTLDMAALQQQQRAMLMASNANLPQRGRPPKNPGMLPYPQPSFNMPKKTPPVTTGDVVDLDSE